MKFFWLPYASSLVNLFSCHVTYAFQSESTLYSCLNVKELLAQNRREIWSLSDCKWTRTHNQLVHKRRLNYLTKLAKWLSCVMNTYLRGAFDCMFFSCHVCSSHVKFQSESTLHSCLNVKELLARSRCEIWSFIAIQSNGYTVLYTVLNGYTDLYCIQSNAPYR